MFLSETGGCEAAQEDVEQFVWHERTVVPVRSLTSIAAGVFKVSKREFDVRSSSHFFLSIFYRICLIFVAFCIVRDRAA